VAARKRALTRGQRAIKFIETYCRIPEGKLVGQPMKLEKFQKDFILAVLDNKILTKRAILSMARKNGKGLALDTPIPTPHGWTTMGALRPGDRVFDETGASCTVKFVSPIHVGLKCWRLTFSDGTSIVADEQHRWLTTPRWRPWAASGRRPKTRLPEVVTTPQIADSVRVPRSDGGVEHNHSIGVAGALRTADVELPLDPYLLGCWLGDGSTYSARLTAGDQDVQFFRAAVGDALGSVATASQGRTAWTVGLTSGRGGVRATKIQAVLRRLGVLGDKHIPEQYLWAGTAQRRAMLQGLMDTDGTATPTGQSGAVSCSFANTNERIARGVLQLARSLGLKATLRTRDAKLEGRAVGLVHEVQFTAWREDAVFRLPRKLERLKPRPDRPTRSSTLKIVACEPVPSMPTVCIQVDSPSRLFLAGEGMTPTHNTALIAAILLVFLVGPEARRNSQIVSGAMSKDQAALVHSLAAKMVRLDARLSELVKIVPSGKRLIGLPLNVEYRAMAADAATGQGLSPRLAILDEVGQVRGPKSDFVEAIETAQGAYDDALLLAISTQAPNDGDLLSIWIDDALNGGDPAYVCHLYTTPIELELEDKKGWKLSNPGLGKFRSEVDLENQVKKAIRMPSAEAGVRNLLLNQRVEMRAPFVTKSVWEKNAGVIDQSLFEGGPIFLGIDLSSRVDLTAIVAVAKDDQDTFHVKVDCFTPEDGVKDRAHADRAPYDVWVKQGVLHTTPGGSVDPDYVAAWMLRTYGRCQIVAVAFDRWRMDTFELALKRIKDSDDPDLASLGALLPEDFFEERLVPFGQGTKDMSPALDTLEAELVNGRMRHGGHPVLQMCAANARVHKDAAGNRKFEKQKSSGRIDAMVALAMALGIAVSKKDLLAETFFEAW
jgi:phage terminase large subunit-like protein